eukprot:jgi/Pico_ML_1/53088/g3699.t1
MASIRVYEGFRAVAPGVAASTSSRSLNRSSGATFRVVAQKKVVLKQDVSKLGKKGELVNVLNGFYRNHLLPKGMAEIASESILEQIRIQQEKELEAKEALKKEARAMATALATIGKFTIKKKVGEKDQIFGSVTPQEVIEAIKSQTGRDLEKKDLVLPEIKQVGTYNCEIKLHPEVIGTFKVVVEKLPQA